MSQIQENPLFLKFFNEFWIIVMCCYNMINLKESLLSIFITYLGLCNVYILWKNESGIRNSLMISLLFFYWNPRAPHSVDNHMVFLIGKAYSWEGGKEELVYLTLFCLFFNSFYYGTYHLDSFFPSVWKSFSFETVFSESILDISTSCRSFEIFLELFISFCIFNMPAMHV